MHWESQSRYQCTVRDGEVISLIRTDSSSPITTGELSPATLTWCSCTTGATCCLTLQRNRLSMIAEHGTTPCALRDAPEGAAGLRLDEQCSLSVDCQWVKIIFLSLAKKLALSTNFHGRCSQGRLQVGGTRGPPHCSTSSDSPSFG